MRTKYLAMCLVLLLVGLSIDMAKAEARNKVFILHSYEMGHVCGQPQHDGVIQALEAAGFGSEKVEFLTYAMDTKSKNNTAEAIANQAKIAHEKIRAFKPDVLVTLDDNAFRSVALQLVDTGLPIVFSGMNNLPKRYNQTKRWLESLQSPRHNITGVYEKLHFVTAVRVHKKIIPSLKKIRIFSDNSPTGKALVRQIKLEIKQAKLPVDYDFFITDSWQEYRAAVIKTNDSNIGALYPVALLLKDKYGKSYTGKEILAWTAKNSTKPSIPLNFAFVEQGIFGGASVDFNSMGQQAGAMVARILQGTRVGSIPIEDAKRYALVFHHARAKALGITIPNDILMAADAAYGD